jgi:isopenicillin-N epimerase
MSRPAWAAIGTARRLVSGSSLALWYGRPMATSPAVRFGHAQRARWRLDPDLTYLNHGTVGATPRDVLEAQQRLRDTIEREPARFLLRELADIRQRPMRGVPHMRVAAAAVATFVGARPADLVFVDNATTGVNAVLRSLTFAPGEEILLTDHTYGAVARTAAYIAQRTGAIVRSAELPGPPYHAEELADAIDAASTPRTRVLVIDHVTSGSALILPVADIAARARARGIAVLVDGAHAPGAIPLDVPSLGVDWYVANLHKWAMAPRSSAFLWATPDRQVDLHPTVISWGFEQGFHAEFDLVGTRDPTPWLTAPAGLAFLESLGLDALRVWNHALVWDAACVLADRWRVPLPADESMVGPMVTLQLPSAVPADVGAVQALRDALLFEDRIEVQMHVFKGRAWVRLCGQAYVEPSDMERFREAVGKRVGR